MQSIVGFYPLATFVFRRSFSRSASNFRPCSFGFKFFPTVLSAGCKKRFQAERYFSVLFGAIRLAAQDRTLDIIYRLHQLIWWSAQHVFMHLDEKNQLLRT